MLEYLLYAVWTVQPGNGSTSQNQERGAHQIYKIWRFEGFTGIFSVSNIMLPSKGGMGKAKIDGYFAGFDGL